MEWEDDFNKPQFPEEYIGHQVFDEIKYMMEFYDHVSYSCFGFVPSGAPAMLNYASYIYTALQGTLDSIRTLLEIGRINDAIVLVRKYFDDVLVEIYTDVTRKDNYDWENNFVVKDVEEWITGKHRIPSLKKILSILEKSDSTKELYPFFGWDTYLKNYREYLDDSVHSNKFVRMVANCNNVFIPGREKYLNTILRVLRIIFTMHLAFMFYLNGVYFMASTYMEYKEVGETPPEGCESWPAKFAQEAFDKYIKPRKELAEFIKANCSLDLE